MAIKIYQKEKLKEGSRLKGVQREIQIMVLLRNVDGVGKLLDLVETKNHVNLVMEYCDGHDIYTNIK